MNNEKKKDVFDKLNALNKQADFVNNEIEEKNLERQLEDVLTTKTTKHLLILRNATYNVLNRRLRH